MSLSCLAHASASGNPGREPVDRWTGQRRRGTRTGTSRPFSPTTSVPSDSRASWLRAIWFRVGDPDLEHLHMKETRRDVRDLSSSLHLPRHGTKSVQALWQCQFLCWSLFREYMLVCCATERKPAIHPQGSSRTEPQKVRLDTQTHTSECLPSHRTREGTTGSLGILKDHLEFHENERFR